MEGRGESPACLPSQGQRDKSAKRHVATNKLWQGQMRAFGAGAVTCQARHVPTIFRRQRPGYKVHYQVLHVVLALPQQRETVEYYSIIHICHRLFVYSGFIKQNVARTTQLLGYDVVDRVGFRTLKFHIRSVCCQQIYSFVSIAIAVGGSPWCCQQAGRWFHPRRHCLETKKKGDSPCPRIFTASHHT